MDEPMRPARRSREVHILGARLTSPRGRNRVSSFPRLIKSSKAKVNEANYSTIVAYLKAAPGEYGIFLNYLNAQGQPVRSEPILKLVAGETGPRCALLAILDVLGRTAGETVPVCCVTDLNFIPGCFTDALPTWCKTGHFFLSNGKEAANADIWRKVGQQSQGRPFIVRMPANALQSNGEQSKIDQLWLSATKDKLRTFRANAVDATSGAVQGNVTHSAAPSPIGS